MKKLALAILAASCLSTTAIAQDARTVITNAQGALGNVQSITYSGAARDVAFQQCGANATALICYGTHDPMRPITNYVRVIDLAAPTSRHTGSTASRCAPHCRPPKSSVRPSGTSTRFVATSPRSDSAPTAIAASSAVMESHRRSSTSMPSTR